MRVHVSGHCVDHFFAKLGERAIERQQDVAMFSEAEDAYRQSSVSIGLDTMCDSMTWNNTTYR